MKKIVSEFEFVNRIPVWIPEERTRAPKKSIFFCLVVCVAMLCFPFRIVIRDLEDDAGHLLDEWTRILKRTENQRKALLGLRILSRRFQRRDDA